MKKVLSIICFMTLIVIGNASAQFSNCSHMSKNPKCWEGKDHTWPNRPVICPVKSHCAVIQSVKLTKWNYYSCKGTDNISFDCTKLVEEYGENIEGEKVLVTVPYVDACHVPGACDPRACMPGWGSASVSSQCQ